MRLIGRLGFRDREVCVSRSRKLVLVTGSFCCLAFERLVLHIGAWEAGAVGDEADEMVHCAHPPDLLGSRVPDAGVWCSTCFASS